MIKIFALSRYKSVVLPLCMAIVLVTSMAVPGQAVGTLPYNSQEVSEIDGIPVLIKHLPEWETRRDRITFVRDTSTLKAVLGERPILDLVDFSAGTEAVTAPYPAGKLLIVEYTTPQVSVESDAKYLARLIELGDTGTVYRRIGNYSVFVFDGPDPAAATALLEQVKYEKNVQWLGDDPYLLRRAERAFINTTSGIFTSTVLVILMGIGLSIAGGLIAGTTYFLLRVRRRAAMTAYTDAGGMIRLNLDGFTPDIVPERLLNK